MDENHRQEFLAAMANVANSVTIVTTVQNEHQFGATVSSFCSVSADPPAVLVCLNHSGVTAKAVAESKLFCVNVLPEGASELANKFALISAEEKTIEFERSHWTASSNGCPMLSGVTAFDCKVTEAIKSSSHMIFIGEVVAMQQGAKPPLIYLNRQYRQLKEL